MSEGKEKREKEKNCSINYTQPVITRSEFTIKAPD